MVDSFGRLSCMKSLSMLLLTLIIMAITGFRQAGSSTPAFDLSDAFAYEIQGIGSPVVVGWGGPRGDESSLSSPYHDESNPSSLVFPGEQASNLEAQVLRLQSMGFNAVRFSFAPEYTNPDGGFMYS